MRVLRETRRASDRFQLIGSLVLSAVVVCITLGTIAVAALAGLLPMHCI